MKGKKEMKFRKLLCIPILVSVLFIGCHLGNDSKDPNSVIDNQLADPNSALNQAINVVDASANAVKDAAPAAGPYGWIAGLVATAIASATGVYKVYQKNAVIKTDKTIVTAQQREMIMIRDVTKAIVKAVETVGDVPLDNGNGTLGKTVKDVVAQNLEDSKLTMMGKAIITGLKETQKSS